MPRRKSQALATRSHPAQRLAKVPRLHETDQMSPPVAAEPLPSHSHVLVHPVSSSSAREARSLVDGAQPSTRVTVLILTLTCRRTAIRAHRRRDAAPAQTPAPRPASSNSSSPLYFPWRLSNKYYTASVAFRIVPPSDSEPQEDVRSHLTEGDEPAVVVVAPASAVRPVLLPPFLSPTKRDR